jgi:hypothetical protein
MIRKIKVDGKIMYRVVSHTSGRNMGTYSSRPKAEKRLKQIARFRKK